MSEPTEIMEEIAEALATAQKGLRRRRHRHALVNQACYRVEEALEMVGRFMELDEAEAE